MKKRKKKDILIKRNRRKQMEWTKEQKQAILEDGSNILVAAAAGSGKTAVLVQRIIHKIVDEKIDIDHMLIVTFTNAAAAEMKERILQAIDKKIEENPQDRHLQKQVLLLHKANICTIHSFCLDVLRNHFYEMDISANTRIADTSEIELLKQEVMEELFEQKYLENSPEFLKLLEIYTGYREDQELKNLIMAIYHYIQSAPFPEEWLQEKVEFLSPEHKDSQDFSNTIWGKILLDTYLEEIRDSKHGLDEILKQIQKEDSMQKYTQVIQRDKDMLEQLEQINLNWEQCYSLANSISFEKWPIDRKQDSMLKDWAKQERDGIKKQVQKATDRYMWCCSEEAREDIGKMYPILKSLQKMVLQFSEQFAAKKREKNCMDFHDMEHFALKILLKKEGNAYLPTDTAKSYQDKFSFVCIDEYQDSNLVQEYLLKSVSKGNNIFMVGDVKQSIYKFRRACPELFLQKYHSYHLPEQGEKKQGLKIQLFKNFRSRQNILDITNFIFAAIMDENLGDINYTQEEYLNLGAEFPIPEKEITYAGKTELHILDLAQKEEGEEENEQPVEEPVENIVLEAKLVANQIKQLMSSSYQVYDKKQQAYRPIQYRDMVILLRTTTQISPIFEKELTDLEIPTFSDTSMQYLESIEIQTIMSVLKIIDNPMQDIPLVTVLKSNIGGFTDNDLIKIRLEDRQSCFYQALLQAKLTTEDSLREKIVRFLEKREKWEKEVSYLALDELIWEIYMDTGYYHYVSLLPNGEMRQANLRLLFERAKEYEKASFKGLFHFIGFIDKLKMGNGDLGSAKLIGENENVVKIMSIHKSKGLEFPIVFLANSGRKFNLMDLNAKLLFHQELGFGPSYIDETLKIEYNTLAKEAIKLKTKTEILSEEMRVLYVALTRAKEKLFMMGLSKDWEKEIKQKEQLLARYPFQGKIPSAVVKKYKSYLDWIQLVYVAKKEKAKELMNVIIHHKQELLPSETIEKEQKKSIPEEMKQYETEYDKNSPIIAPLEQTYPYELATKMITKTSATTLKQLAYENQKRELEAGKKEEKIVATSKTFLVPKFLQEKLELSNAEKGTLMHWCIQKLEEKQEYTIETIQQMIQQMQEKKMMTEQEASAIDVDSLYQYTKSELFEQLKQAKEVHKEEPFYIHIPAREIYHQEVEEQILVQGIIDLYYIDQQDKISLIDYKTDFVIIGQERILIEKYREQLELYRKALEATLEKKVSRMGIYSTRLVKTIWIENE